MMVLTQFLTLICLIYLLHYESETKICMDCESNLKKKGNEKFIFKTQKLYILQIHKL